MSCRVNAGEGRVAESSTAGSVRGVKNCRPRIAAKIQNIRRQRRTIRAIKGSTKLVDAAASGGQKDRGPANAGQGSGTGGSVGGAPIFLVQDEGLCECMNRRDGQKGGQNP